MNLPELRFSFRLVLSTLNIPMGRKKTTKKSSEPKKRQGWTTVEQEEYLNANKPGFLVAQTTKSAETFWPAIYETWWSRWPLPPPTEKDIEAGFTNENRIATRELLSRSLLITSHGRLGLADLYNLISVFGNGTTTTHSSHPARSRYST